MSSTMEIKQQNLDCLREAIRSAQSGTKSELARMTGLSFATCNNLLNEMAESGELLQEEEASRGGRKASRYYFNKDFRHVLCIYLKEMHGKYMFGYTIADMLGDPLEQEMFHPEIINYDYLMDQIGIYLEKYPLVDSIVVAIPGNVLKGKIVFCDIKDLEGYNLQREIKKKYDKNAIVENDMSFAAYGAHAQLAKDACCLVALDFPVDSPVGAGIVINGKIYNGFSRFAGELARALEEGGFPRKTQLAGSMEKESLLKMVRKSIVMLVSILNPERIELMCEVLDQSDLQQILKACEEYIDSYHMPEISLSGKNYAFCMEGMVRAALNSQMFQFELTI